MRYELTEFQTEEVGRILTAEAPVLELLAGQLTKTRQQMNVARGSGVFDDAHARALEHSLAEIRNDLDEAKTHVRALVLQFLSPNSLDAKSDWESEIGAGRLPEGARHRTVEFMIDER